MTIVDYFDKVKNEPTPVQKLIDDLCVLCDREELAVRRWLKGYVIPDINIQEKISKYLGIPIKELFPVQKPKKKKKKVRKALSPKKRNPKSKK